MCHNRGRYYGAYDAPQPFGYYDRRGLGCHHRRHGGPISALIALAVPLLTQNNNQQQQQQRSLNNNNEEKAQDAYYYQSGSSSAANLAPQISGRTAARDVPTTTPVSGAPAPPTAASANADDSSSSTPRDPPPAYEDTPARSLPALEKSLEGITLSPNTSSSSSSSRSARRAPEYTPIGTTYTSDSQREVPAVRTEARGQSYDNSTYIPQQQQQQQQQQLQARQPLFLDSTSRWAAKLQRKEDKVRAKMARKAEKYARKERRALERVF